MKITVRAAMVAISIASISPAFAGDGDGQVANTYFTQLPGVIAQAPAPQAPSVATAQNGHVLTYAANSSRGTWLFPPHDGGGANS
jgi:hypothetical protein